MAFALLLLLVNIGVDSQTFPVALPKGIPVATGTSSTAPPALPLPTIQSFSGSPLLLEVVLDDPERQVATLRIDSGLSTQEYRIPPDVERDPLVLRVSPFFASGVYQLNVEVTTTDGRTAAKRFEIGFVDFVWGRDNISFGNNRDYESVIGTFGEVLAGWVGERFGEVDEGDLVLLTDYMYGMFGRNTGRCYAFAGSEVRYWRWPELRPSWYETTHDIRGNRARNQRAMNYLQFDIVFDHFVAGPGAGQIAQPMDRAALAREAHLIAERIAADEPVAVGFAGDDLHHSMLVFGYIRDPARRTVDLLVANNWKSDEKLNIHSRDAEIVRVFLDDAHADHPVEWRYEAGVRDRTIDRLFVVDVRGGEYEHDAALFEAMLAELRAEFRAAGDVRVVVEEAAGARLTDGVRFSGQIGSRRVDDLEEVWFERVSRAYRLRYPADRALELELTDDVGARVLAAFPGATPDEVAVRVIETDAPEDARRVTRHFGLAPEPAEP